MNLNLLAAEFSVGDQQRILRELQGLPDELMILKKKLDEHNREIVSAKNRLIETEYNLENAKTTYVLTNEFQELKNDTQRKAYIFSMTQDFEYAVVFVRQHLTVLEANLAEFRSEHDATYQKLRALMIVSEQIAAYMNYASSGELP